MVRPKVKAQAGGGGLAGALTTVVIFILKENGVELSPELAAAIGTLITVLVGFLAGYFKGDAPPS